MTTLFIRGDDSFLGPLIRAVEAATNGDRASARAHLQDTGFQAFNVTPRKPPSKVELIKIFRRDSFLCRHCGRRTVFLPILRALSEAFPEAFPYHPSWKRGVAHPYFLVLAATHDHLVPLARGGTDSVENFVTACYQCQDTKKDWLLEELLWEAPPPKQVEWDGLSGAYLPMCGALGIKPNPAWAHVLRTSTS